MKTIARLDAALKADTLPKIRKGATAGLPITQIFAALRELGWSVTTDEDGGRHSFLVKAPDGAYVVLTAFDAKELGYRPRYALLDWLTARPTFLPSVSATLGMPTLEAERAEKARPRFASDEATCPCCFQAYKTRIPAGKTDLVMVLHGYRRPGHGQAIGECFGVAYKPFEISPEGTIAYRTHLGAVLENVRDYLARIEADTEPSIVVRSPRGSLVTHLRGTEGYEAARAREAKSQASRITHLESEIAFLTKKIDRWTPKPLPSEGQLVEVVSILGEGSARPIVLRGTMTKRTKAPAKKTPTHSDIAYLARQAGYPKHEIALLDWKDGLIRVGVRCGWTDAVIASAWGRDHEIAVTALEGQLNQIIAENAHKRALENA
jgi:hypothetical protein